MSKLINAVGERKSALGFYPPDHQTNIGGATVGWPSPNQLFYELSGKPFPLQLNNFYVLGRSGTDQAHLHTEVFWNL